MIPRSARCLILALLVHALAGCASDGLQVSTAFDPLTRFPRQATYVWDTAANRLPDDPRIAQLELGPKIEEAARGALAARGYREDPAAPNYRLSYQVAVNTWFGGEGSHSLGTLSLQFVDGASGRRIWMGFGRAEVLVGLTDEERELRLRDVMDSLLEDFPPNQRGNQ